MKNSHIFSEEITLVSYINSAVKIMSLRLAQNIREFSEENPLIVRNGKKTAFR